MTPIAQTLKIKVPDIRYVAVNSGGKIVEMEQFSKTNNPPISDLMEELLVNPTVLDITGRRGDLDLDGVHFVVIRYGPQYQAIFRHGDGHVSVGIDLDKDPISTVEAVQKALNNKINPTIVEATVETTCTDPVKTESKVQYFVEYISNALCRALSSEFRVLPKF